MFKEDMSSPFKNDISAIYAEAAKSKMKFQKLMSLLPPEFQAWVNEANVSDLTLLRCYICVEMRKEHDPLLALASSSRLVMIDQRIEAIQNQLDAAAKAAVEAASANESDDDDFENDDDFGYATSEIQFGELVQEPRTKVTIEEFTDQGFTLTISAQSGAEAVAEYQAVKKALEG